MNKELDKAKQEEQPKQQKHLWLTYYIQIRNTCAYALNMMFKYFPPPLAMLNSGKPVPSVNEAANLN